MLPLQGSENGRVITIGRKPCLCCSEFKSKCFALGSKRCEVLNVKSNLQLLFKEKIDFLHIIDYVVCDHYVHLIGKKVLIYFRILIFLLHVC